MTAPVLTFRHVFGVKSDVSCPLVHLDESTVIFAAGHQVIVQNINTKQQRTIPATYLAVAECGSSFPVLSIFDFRSWKRRRTFGGASMSHSAVVSGAQHFHTLLHIEFSADNRHLIALSGGPDHVVMEWQWQKEQLTASGVCRLITQPHTVSYSPSDSSQLMVSGEGGFTLMNVDWDSATITAQAASSASSQANNTTSTTTSGVTSLDDGDGSGELDVSSVDVTCHAWLDGERCLMGTSQGHLILTQHGSVVSHCSVTSQDASEEEQGDREGSGSVNSVSSFHPAKAVHCLCAFGGGIAVGCDGGVVQMYRPRSTPIESTTSAGTEANGSVSVSVSVSVSGVTVHPPPRSPLFPFVVDLCHVLPHHPAHLIHVELSPSLTHLVVVTDTQQCFTIPQPMTRSLIDHPPHTVGLTHSTAIRSTPSHPSLHSISSSSSSSSSSPLPFPRSITPLLSLHHSGAITGLSLCVRKPLAVSCGVDRSIRLWNLLTLECELVVYFPEQPLSVSFHPSGLHLLVGFADKLRLCNVLMNEIRAFRELPIKQCMECVFSHGGQSFACVNGTLIQVYDTYTGEQLAVFRGHTGQVRSLAWSADDLRLISAGVDGAVYQRKMGSQGRLQELVQKGCKFTCALVTDQDRMYAVGDDRMLKEIVDRSVHKTLDAGCVLTYIATDHAQPTSKLIAGTDNGVVRSFAFPLTGIVKDYQCHSRAVVRIAVSHDDRFVVSVSEDGTLAIFNAKGAVNPLQLTSPSASSVPLTSTDPTSLWTLPIPLSSPASLSTPDSVGWSDDVLVSRSSLDDASHLLFELRGRVDELSASNDYQLRLHEMNYSEKVKEVAEKYSLQLEHDRSKVEMITDEKTEMEGECQEKLRQIKEHHTNKLQTEDRAHQQTIIKQIAEYAQLQDRMEQQAKQAQHALHQLDHHHQQQMTALHDHWSSAVNQASASLTHALRSVDRVTMEYSETKDQTASDQDAEMESIKAGYTARVLAERDSLLRFKGEVGIMKKKLSSLLKEIEEQKEQLKASTEREESLLASITVIDQRIAHQRSTMKDKDGKIAESERAIADLKKDNGELEKFKFVLDHQIKQLKRQIEPREAEINQIKRTIQVIDTTLEQHHTRNAVIAQQIDTVRRDNQLLQSTIHHTRDTTRSIHRQLITARRHLTDCAHHLGDTQQLDHAIRQLVQHLHSSHNHHDDITPSHPHPPSSSSSSSDVLSEFVRHRGALVDRVSSLSSELSTRWREGRKMNVAVMQDNITLIKEIQKTRKQQHQITTTKPPPAPHTMREVEVKEAMDDDQPNSVSLISGGGGEAEAHKLLALQRAQILNLRERLYTLQMQPRSPALSSTSPSSTSPRWMERVQDQDRSSMQAN